MKHAILLLLAGAAAPAAAAPCTSRDPIAVTEAVSAMYAALEQDDAPALAQLLDPKFYAFDDGARFNGMALPALIRKAKANGRIYHWSVTQPDVRITCDTAWIGYVNKGLIGDANGTQPMLWLESALLRYELGKWRIVFLQSQRARTE